MRDDDDDDGGGDDSDDDDREGGADTFEDLGAELFVDMPVVPKARQGAAFVRRDAAQIANDPLRLLRRRAGWHSRSGSLSSQNSRSSSPHHGEPTEKLRREQSFKANRRHKFLECLSREDVDMVAKVAWSGIPEEFRPIAWPLLLGHLPLPMGLRSSTLERRRGEYQSLVDLTSQIWHQIEIDVPRTRPGVQLWMHASTQRSLERILYVWAMRHPASGYVQGINDLATPFFEVFLSAYVVGTDPRLKTADTDPEEIDPSILPPPVLAAVEADSFWCLSRLLNEIPENYTTAQPGIQRSVKRMAELVARIDAPLSEHLATQGVEFMQFAFRWMNCLLMREISVKNTAEGSDAFSQFHLYVCSAFLVRWSDKLRAMDFQMLLSQAFLLKSIWHNAQSHFMGK
ncbi:RabGAP/TBC [Russula earlei]|uniref:RabGAP/TBC n=1 Tax=Russula earlei TaxID=71964 RepID=A0ACC0TWF2_9AGAM|nr:RabGAP/TBC [Russula earlei]